jgi:5'-deoxynucleotidase YfbR-like HD superfamily hydrolase
MTADINRFHCHPNPALRNSGDTVAKHHARVHAMGLSLCAHIGHILVGSDLPEALRKHDLPEIIMGDWPAPLMTRYPWMKPVKWVLEWQIKRDMGLRWRLTRKEKAILHFLDKLDCQMWARHCKAADTDEWRRAESKLWARAKALGAQAWLQERLDRGVE